MIVHLRYYILFYLDYMGALALQINKHCTEMISSDIKCSILVKKNEFTD